MTIAHQQMIEFLEKLAEGWTQHTGWLETHYDEKDEEVRKAILSELRLLDEHTLPVLPEGYWLSRLEYDMGMYYVAIEHNGEPGIIYCDHGQGETPNSAVLNVMAKIPADKGDGG